MWICHGWLVGTSTKFFYHSEKRGGPPKSQTHVDSFRDAFVENGLFDLGYTGYDYIWCRRQDGEVVVEERLDRFCATVEWSLCFPETSVLHIESDISDHLPILLKCYKRKSQFQKTRKRFHFDNMWELEPSCEEVIRKAWEGCRGADAINNVLLKMGNCSCDLFNGMKKNLATLG